MSLEGVLARIDDQLDDAIERLKDFLRIPSISTDPAFKSDVDRAADWMVEQLQAIGATAEKHPTTGHPMVVGHLGEGKPHLLFYGHYDVQPVDPLKLWHRDPFDPVLEDTPKGKVIRARGAADDKGQLMTFVEACRAIIAEHGKLPCKVTFFFEGEEESGSPSLVPYLKAHGNALKADLALICDTGLYDSNTPAITTQLRGLLAEEVIVKAADMDLHSGMFGGIAMNPIRVLTKALGALHDDQGRVTLDGFYDDVPELPEVVRAQWQNLAFDHAKFLGDVGLEIPAGEQDRTPLEMIWSRPTAEINGITGGYTGDGFKTVLPAQASAKVSFRLVGQQDPDKIHAAFVKHMEAYLPADCTMEFPMGRGAGASMMRIENPAFEKARSAISKEWPKPAVFAGCGGSIPIAGFFQNLLGMDVLLAGWGGDDDLIHSPNEKYDLRAFHLGTRSWARVIMALAE
jgi:acetylornithine deacetylase/succinyl-diaminopimelate desuccinylase-like protein